MRTVPSCCPICVFRGVKLGLLINFNAFPVVKGIHRMVNKL